MALASFSIFFPVPERFAWMTLGGNPSPLKTVFGLKENSLLLDSYFPILG